MRLQTIHETRIAHPPDHATAQPNHSGQSTTRTSPIANQAPHSSKKQHTQTPQPHQQHDEQQHKKTQETCPVKINRTWPKATFATPLPKPTTATGVSRFVVFPSPTCRNQLVSNTMSPHAQSTTNPLASKRPQLLGHLHCNPNTRPPHCLEQHTNATANHT